MSGQPPRSDLEILLGCGLRWRERRQRALLRRLLDETDNTAPRRPDEPQENPAPSGAPQAPGGADATRRDVSPGAEPAGSARVHTVDEFLAVLSRGIRLARSAIGDQHDE